MWVVDARTSQVATRAVTLGAAQNDSVLIAGGLDGGETVVTAGVHMLHAGQKVKVLVAHARPSRRRERVDEQRSTSPSGR